MRHDFASYFHQELGLFTFPVTLVRSQDGKLVKKPSITKWRELPLPESPPLYQNYGIRLDPRYLVVDVDVKNGKRGQDTWNKMRAMLTPANRAALDRMQERLQCVTMTGGRHHWFRLPPDIRITKNPAGFPDVEFLSEGAYVVGPGTDFGTGVPYAILSGAIDLDYLPMYPDEWIAATMWREKERRIEDREFTNSPAAIQQFTSYCQNCPPAIEGCMGDMTTLKVALTARDLGLDGEVCYRIMWAHFNPRCQPAWDEGGLETKIHNAYTYGSNGVGNEDYSHLLVAEGSQAHADLDESVEEEGYRWNRTGKGAVKENDENNTICYLKARNRGEFQNELWGLFRYNSFTRSPEYVMAPPWYHPEEALEHDTYVPTRLDDAELGHIKHFLFQKYGYVAKREVIYKAVDFVARHQSYHPIRSWLRSLEWDGVPRLEEWLAAYCGAESTAYTRAIGPKVLLGAVSRIMEPGCKMDYTLVLEGPQGSRKSTVCEILGVRKEWYAVLSPETDKDTRQILSRKWIIEYAEIDALGKREAASVKNFMTTATDTYRPPYGTGPEDFPRQSIFLGTVNPGAAGSYLNDGTGGRRFWPVETGDIDTEGLRADIEQLYAEAMALYRAGAKPYLSEQYSGLLAEEVAKRQIIDPITEALADYFSANPHEVHVNVKWLAVNVCNINVERYDANARRRVLEALKYLGWVACGKHKLYVRPVGWDESDPLIGIEHKMQAFRKELSRPTVFSYTYLARSLELGALNTALKQRFGRRLREMEGVEVFFSAEDRTSKIRVAPWAHLEDI